MHDSTPIYRAADGTLEDANGVPVTCSWFMLCDQLATDVQEHPVLGGVPICERCATRHRETR